MDAAVSLPRRAHRERAGLERHGLAEPEPLPARGIDELHGLAPAPGRALEHVDGAGVLRRAGVVVRRADCEPVAVERDGGAETVAGRDLEAEDLLLERPRARHARVDERRAALASEPGVGLGGADREGVAGERERPPEAVGQDRRRELGLQRPGARQSHEDVDGAGVVVLRGHDEGVPFERHPRAELARGGVRRRQLRRHRPGARVALVHVDAAGIDDGKVVTGHPDRHGVAVGGDRRAERVALVAERVAGRIEPRLADERKRWRRRRRRRRPTPDSKPRRERPPAARPAARAGARHRSEPRAETIRIQGGL